MLETLPIARALPFTSLVRRRLQRHRRACSSPPGLQLPVKAGTHLGYAHVVAVEHDGRPRVRLDDEEASVLTADWAIPYRYLPRVGDVLWVIGRAESCYVLGVVHGRGRSQLWFQGDVDLSSAGLLSLSSDLGLRLVGRVVQLKGRSLEVLAGAIQVRTTSAAERVKGLLRIVAGRVQRVTEQDETRTARKITVLGADLVRYDAEVTVIG